MKFNEAYDLLVTEMVKYDSPVAYMKDNKFEQVSTRNAQAMKILAQDDRYVYTVHNLGGYVFSVEDFKSKSQKIQPIMRVSLRDSGVEDYKQAHKLRIKEGYASENITTRWYLAYVEQFGNIVSDTEHLKGGFLLWKSFIKMSQTDPKFEIRSFDLSTGEYNDLDLTEENLWSTHPDRSLENIVLVMSHK